MSKDSPVIIKGHKNKIQRLGGSSKYTAGLWRFSCECGATTTSKGQAIVAQAKKKHENEVVFAS